MSEERDRRRARRESHDSVLGRVYRRIRARADSGWKRTVYDLPACVMGCPYDREECARHVARQLRRSGYVVEVYDTVLYVSWDPGEMNGEKSEGGK